MTAYHSRRAGIAGNGNVGDVGLPQLVGAFGQQLVQPRRLLAGAFVDSLLEPMEQSGLLHDPVHLASRNRLVEAMTDQGDLLVSVPRECFRRREDRALFPFAGRLRRGTASRERNVGRKLRMRSHGLAPIPSGPRTQGLEHLGQPQTPRIRLQVGFQFFSLPIVPLERSTFF